MPEHIIKWLGAYLDEELHGKKLEQVEAHLLNCQVCQAELQELKNLQGMLASVPLPENLPTSAELSQKVMHNLPGRSAPPLREIAIEYGWWLVPFALLGIWLFIHIVYLVSGGVWVASWLGWLGEAQSWLLPGIPGYSLLASALEQFNLLTNAQVLSWLEMFERVVRGWFWQLTLFGSVAALYLSWLVLMLKRYQQQRTSQLVNNYL